jgi:hypothetical protein
MRMLSKREPAKRRRAVRIQGSITRDGSDGSGTGIVQKAYAKWICENAYSVDGDEPSWTSAVP